MPLRPVDGSIARPPFSRRSYIVQLQAVFLRANVQAASGVMLFTDVPDAVHIRAAFSIMTNQEHTAGLLIRDIAGGQPWFRCRIALSAPGRVKRPPGLS